MSTDELTMSQVENSIKKHGPDEDATSATTFEAHTSDFETISGGKSDVEDASDCNSMSLRKGQKRIVLRRAERKRKREEEQEKTRCKDPIASAEIGGMQYDVGIDSIKSERKRKRQFGRQDATETLDQAQTLESQAPLLGDDQLFEVQEDSQFPG